MKKQYIELCALLPLLSDNIFKKSSLPKENKIIIKIIFKKKFEVSFEKNIEATIIPIKINMRTFLDTLLNQGIFFTK